MSLLTGKAANALLTEKTLWKHWNLRLISRRNTIISRKKREFPAESGPIRYCWWIPASAPYRSIRCWQECLGKRLPFWGIPTVREKEIWSSPRQAVWDWLLSQRIRTRPGSLCRFCSRRNIRIILFPATAAMASRSGKLPLRNSLKRIWLRIIMRMRTEIR